MNRSNCWFFFVFVESIPWYNIYVEHIVRQHKEMMKMVAFRVTVNVLECGVFVRECFAFLYNQLIKLKYMYMH
jgi:hypothetical protein